MRAMTRGDDAGIEQVAEAFPAEENPSKTEICTKSPARHETGFDHSLFFEQTAVFHLSAFFAPDRCASLFSPDCSFDSGMNDSRLLQISVTVLLI